MTLMRPSALWSFYRRRLRMHAVQEVLAGCGIAAGVALMFAVQVANSSITGSARGILHAITGTANVQLAARDADGFDQRMLARVRAIPGVERVSPLLEQRASIAYRGRRVAVDFVGIDHSLQGLGGLATGNLLLGGLFLGRSIMLPAAMGAALHLPSARTAGDDARVTLEVRGHARSVSVGGVVGKGVIGDALANAMLAAASLPYAQQLTGLHSRITRVLVVTRPHDQKRVLARLEALVHGRLKVADVDSETRLLAQATGPNDQATGLFAWISVVVGLLLTFNAMLLTMPERRRFVAEVRVQGFGPRELVQVLGFQALVLGTLSSLAGLAIGDVLSLTTSHSPPGYLAFAFPLGVQRVVQWQTIVLAFVAGISVTCLAAAQPLLDLRRDRAVDAVYLEETSEPGNALTTRARAGLAITAAVSVAATSALLLLRPAATIAGVFALALATLLVIPIVCLVILRLADQPARRWRLNMLSLAVTALRATSLRSLALAATGAVAVFGSVAIEGAHRDLLHGLYQDYRQYAGTADIWITNYDDDLALEPFDSPRFIGRISRLVGVSGVRPYFGGLLDVPGRRAWVIARSGADRPMVPPSQIVAGDLASATARLRAGGWVTVSQQLADAAGVGVGGTIVLPTPTGSRRFRVAALTTNLGWGPGAFVMNSSDYRRSWASDAPSALEVDLAPGAGVLATKRRIERALGPGVALQVQTTRERELHANALARAGLARLSQISILLLIAAALAMAAAMSTAIWQRRPVLAQLGVTGATPRQVWRALLLETGLVVLAGVLTGAIAGVYGHYLLDRWLHLTTGYPAPFTITGWQAAGTCALVAAAALLATAIPGYFASKAPTRLALNPDT